MAWIGGCFAVACRYGTLSNHRFAEPFVAPMVSMFEDSRQRSVLVVEDESELADMVGDYLREHGFHVETHGRGDTAPERILALQPDAVILDVNLPGLDGFSICRSIRDRFAGIILMLTARGEEEDEITGLDSGADDYLSKPVRPRVLLARLRMHWERGEPSNGTLPVFVQVGDLSIDAARRRALIQNKEVALTSAEFDLLHLLAANAGRALSRTEIHRAIHGLPYDGLDRSIDLRISRLRKKLGDDPSNPARVLSVRGTGYLLAVPR
jgi:two-component system, OmpR family, response regulator RstA